ncbi:MAG: DUF3343 domain-containing protein [Lachnospiraceae bacterium]|nr:DUF3343 domain-containing protein [Lachnospiraceae bacterium]
MAKDINYYVLVTTYTEAMKIQAMLREGNIPSRISPTPHAIQGIVGCGVSILLLPEDLENARSYMDEHGAKYHSIVPLERQIDPRRIPHV